MSGMLVRRFAAMSVALMLSTGMCSAQNENTTLPKATADAGPKEVPESAGGSFVMRILSGGSVNELKLPSTFTRAPDYLTVDTQWRPNDHWLGEAVCRPRTAPKEPPSIGYTKQIANQTETLIGLAIEAPPCWWPPVQTAMLKITGENPGGDGKSLVLFSGTVFVSVLWLPLLITLLFVAFVYPGCALVAWYVQSRRHRKGLLKEKPTFWRSLDPVQITANTYGRGSLSKMQIFVFTMVIFGVLLFFQFRNGFLANLSTDIMLLLGISAVGAAGGKMTYAAKRRLSLDNWSWLRRKGWLPEKGDVAPRAKWADLFTDSDTKEFDIYSFQMAIFSLVVVVALISTNATGLGAFEIPDQLLALLGLSQVIYVGGKAIEKTGYQELDAKITEVRKHEAAFRDAKARSDAVAAAKEREEFKAGVAQVGDMFWAIYEDQLKAQPPALGALDKLEPESA
jgi:hypothetical protein